MIKCELIIGGYSYKITDDVMNWDDVTISLKRGNYDGVVRSFSSKFEFVNMAYALLKKQYQDNYLGAAASIVISRRNNSWTWNELFRCTLDFSTYSDDGNVIAINAIDDTLAAIIKAKKSIQYEYRVADLYSENLYYDRLEMSSIYNFTASDYFKFYPGSYIDMYITSYNNEITRPYIETDTSERDVICVIQDVPAKGIIVSFDADVFLDNSIVQGFYPALSVDIRLYGPGFDISSTITKGQTKNVKLKFKITKNDFNQSDNKKVYLKISNIKWDETNHNKIAEVHFKKINEFKITYNSRKEPANIDIIPLNVLANKLISSMAGEGSPYGVVIANYLPSMRVDRLSNTYIIAAESARGLSKAKLYTSFKKFTDFMEAEFGYVPVIKGNTIEFGWRNDLYTSMVQKNLGSAVNDYQYSVNSSLIYSSVKVGYDKQDYDSINGRDEFRFTNEFSTGLTLTENTFSLISPYRADAYGIEFLVQKRGEDTTDSDSDNDTFIVGCIRDGLKYVLKRNYTSSQLKGMISSETMFNIEYSPRFMLDANKSYIGACTKHLKFASSNGNSDISINGIKETDDLVIDSPLFTVGEIEVETSDTEVQDELNGLVSLTYNGSTATGYIKQLKINAGKEESVKYSLIVKDIKK